MNTSQSVSPRVTAGDRDLAYQHLRIDRALGAQLKALAKANRRTIGGEASLAVAAHIESARQPADAR